MLLATPKYTALQHVLQENGQSTTRIKCVDPHSPLPPQKKKTQRKKQRSKHTEGSKEHFSSLNKRSNAKCFQAGLFFRATDRQRDRITLQEKNKRNENT